MTRRGWVTTGLVLAVVIFNLTWYYHGWQHWISYETGSMNTPGTAHNYNFHSGFGSEWIPSVINVLGAMAIYLWHHQCAVHGCYRYAWRTTDAGDRACWKHHPVPHHHQTVEWLHRRHHEASQP